ncbi:hypothetical protein SASPL_147531 [Salvia splendens]|uniref:Reverse transcriptase domain-containing protein n=1 Tax=Salvia splendens TaxID=180675 RepID=A0A8X8WFT6_SALSN|nr:hypothetical protein SASPL_147531 [Salvia splendens]
MICLIPKVEAPNSLAKFRPIALCSVIYKLATKTIPNRLKQLMPLIIGPAQSSFVAGRHIYDNIVIAQEAIHSMRNKPDRTAKLSAALVDVIMKCVSTSSMQLLWNGNLTESFKPSRGDKGVRSRPIYLCFADVRTAEASLNVLDGFCGSSGMKVSTAKTSLFFSKNVDIEKRRIIKNLLGVGVVNDLGQYLGVPLLHWKVSKLTYAHILDKMKAKIANWNTAQLSLAGRITLAQAVLSTMPLYAMQTSKLPVGVCTEIGKEIRGFIWVSHRSGQRLSKVAWSKVSRPKDEGGLSLRKLSLVNFAFGMKECWEIFKQPMSLWATQLCSKYKFDLLLGFDPIAPASCTPF